MTGASSISTRRRLSVAWIMAALVTISASVFAGSQGTLILATTTSTQDSGLLDVLVPLFEKEHGLTVKVIAVGTGAALRMASTGDADAILVHAPAAEKKYIESGDLIEGRAVMHNDFVIVGPLDDPAAVKAAASAAGAMRSIAERGTFISRGDESGTHQQEMALWTSAGVDARSLARREETGQGMGATLNVADQRRAYTLTDRGTFLALRGRLKLTILHEGDAGLRNLYHVYVVNPNKHARINAAGARKLVAFLVSEPVQRAIGDFKRAEFGHSLFFPDALPRAPVK